VRVLEKLGLVFERALPPDGDAERFNLYATTMACQ
jgi:hypothetical protein